MTITLGGAEGPETGGRNPLARPAGSCAPQPRVRGSPAPKPPEMVDARTEGQAGVEDAAEAGRKAGGNVTQADDGRGGEKRAPRSPRPNRPRRCPFGGLSTGGGGTGGARSDVQNFCCPAYLQTMVQMIRQNWQRNEGVAGKVTMKFVVQRDGRITNIEVEESGGQFLDLASSPRAPVRTRQIPPLPREFPESTLTVHLVFEYLR